MASTGIGLGASIGLGAGMGFTQYALTSTIFRDNFTWQGAIISTGLGAFGGLLSGAGARNIGSVAGNLNKVMGGNIIATAFKQQANMMGVLYAQQTVETIKDLYAEGVLKIGIATIFSAGMPNLLNFIVVGLEK